MLTIWTLSSYNANYARRKTPENDSTFRSSRQIKLLVYTNANIVNTFVRGPNTFTVRAYQHILSNQPTHLRASGKHLSI